jgi:hypothetical protein
MGDTKLLCNLGQAAIAFLEVSISQISGDTTLLLCQGGTHGNASLIPLSSLAVFSGILGAER